MNLRHFFGTSVLSLGLAVTALMAPAAAAHEGPDHDDLHCIGGRAFGSWDLPDAGGLGMSSGILFRRNGQRAFGIETWNLPPEAPGEPGRIRGFVHTLARPGQPARRIARIAGEFGVGDEGHGRFRAVFLRMTDDANADRPVRIVGGMHGRFRDPSRDPHGADPGPFQARWILCRRQ